MLLTGTLRTLINSGAPDYSICNQAAANLSFVNTSFKLEISNNGGLSYTLVDTIDLSTISGLVFSTFTYDDYDFVFSNFVIDGASSTFQIKVDVFRTGTTDIVTWEKFYLTLSISKDGYLPFLNTFELYNYDVGNCQTIPGLVDTVGNPNFNIILINRLNNMDIYGNQIQAGTSFTALRKPFTNELFIYSLISSQGSMIYTSNVGIINSLGKNSKMSYGQDVTIEQKNVLSNNNYCISLPLNVPKKVWTPELITGITPNPSNCDSCINNLVPSSIFYYHDASNTSVFSLNGTQVFLSEFASHDVLIQIYNYLGDEIFNDDDIVIITYALWNSNPSTFLTPVIKLITPSEIGENILSFIDNYSYTDSITGDVISLFYCTTNSVMSTCNWWTVTASEVCNNYTVKNCSSQPLTVILKLLDNDKVFQELSSNVITPYGTLDFEFNTDGIYLYEFKSTLIDVTLVNSQFYTLPVYCSLESCILSYIKSNICNKITSENCKEKSHYDFNSLLINAHSYFLLLNEELISDYVYTSISISKLNELFTLKTFIDRMVEYCNPSDPCTSCN